MRYWCALFLSICFSTLQGQSLIGNAFGDPVFTHSCKDNDVILYRRNEIVCLRFTQSREEVPVHNFCIDHLVYDSKEKTYIELNVACHLDTAVFQRVKDSLMTIGFSPSVFYNDETTKVNDTIIQAFKVNAQNYFLLKKKNNKYYFEVKKSGVIRTAQFFFKEDAVYKGVFMEFFKWEEHSMLVCFHSYSWDGPDVFVYKIDI